MKILAIDTVTEMCSAALFIGDTRLSRAQKVVRTHSDVILPMVDELLGEAQLGLPQLDAIAFNRGPGSFTGLRITASVVQGLAWASELPVIAISSLATLAQRAYQLTGESNVLACIDARKAEVYWAAYQRQPDGDWQHGGEFVTAAAKMQLPPSVSWYGIGSGWHAYQHELNENPLVIFHGYDDTAYPLAEDMHALVRRAYMQNQLLSPEQALPVYIRDNVASPKQARK